MNARNRFLLSLLAVVVVFQGTSTAFGQASWVGELVMNTKSHKEIKFGDIVHGKQVYFPFSGNMPIKVRDDREGRLRIHDGHWEGWVDKADFVLVRDAPAYFSRRIQANPKDTWALLMRGEGWRQKGEPDNAIKDFDECIRLDPTDTVAFNNRGSAWYSKKDYDKAIRDYDEAIGLDPTNVIAFNNRGNAWRLKKEYDKAIRDYDEAIRLDPKYARAFDDRGAAWTEKREYDKAIRDFDEAIRLDPKNPSPVYDKACVYALQGRTDPAIDTLRQCLEVGYRNFDHMAKDSDLDSIRNDSRYKELLKKYAK
jgi:tetratricopeptide (TPR) repeat protein